MLTMQRSQIPIDVRLQLLNAALIFGPLERPVLEDLAVRLSEATYGPGQEVVAEGEQADSMFVIAKGKAEISVRQGADRVVLATVAEGEFFGEMAFLNQDTKRRATVTSLSELRLLVLSAAIFRRVVASRPQLLESAREIAEARAKVNFIKRFSPFKSLPPDKLKVLVSRLDKVIFAPDTTVVRQGEIGQECYLIISGSMEVSVRDPGRPERTIATLYSGSVVGETALLAEGPRNATVRTIETTEALVIQRDTLLGVMREGTGLDKQLLTILERRERPRRIDTVAVQEQTTAEGETVRVLKNEDLGTYVRLSPAAWFLWKHLDGLHTLKDLTIALMSETDELAPEKVAAIVSELKSAGFIKGRTLRSDVSILVSKMSRWERAQTIARRVMEWSLVWNNADPAFALLYRLFGKVIFSRVAQVLFAVVSASGLVAFLSLTGRVSPFLSNTAQSRGVLLFLIPAVIAPLLVHELGHAITTKHYRKEVRHAGVGWYWFGPVAFVDTSDIWGAGRMPRIAVSMAGPYAQVILAGVASHVAWLSSSPVVSASLWQYALLSHIGVLMNFNPLLEYDGYYVLSDLVNRPNLRHRALEWLGRFARGEVDRRLELRGHRLEFLYAGACVIAIPLMAYMFVITYRVLLESHLEPFVPQFLAAGIPWLITLTICVAAAITVLGEMRLFRRMGEVAKARAP